MSDQTPPTTCLHCATPTEVGARFCPGCGATLTAVAAPTPQVQAPVAGGVPGAGAAYSPNVYDQYRPVHQETARFVPGRIPNHLAMAIVALLMSWPFGIAALVNSVKVDSLAAAGDVYGAQEASRKARMWSWWAIGTSVGLGLAYLLLMLVVLTAGASQPA